MQDLTVSTVVNNGSMCRIDPQHIINWLTYETQLNTT